MVPAGKLEPAARINNIKDGEPCHYILHC